jgi:hypothetical protein
MFSFQKKSTKMAMWKQPNSSTKRSAHDIKGQSSRLQKTAQPDESNLPFEESFSLPKAVLRPPVPVRKKTKSQLLKEKEGQVSTVDCVPLYISHQKKLVY